MPIDNGGSLLSSSTPLDTKQQWQTIKDRVGLDNTDDYYTFKLDSRSSFNLVLSNLSDNVDVRLLNYNGSEIAHSSIGGIGNETINKSLDVGTYHIQVHQEGDTGTSYTLKVRSNYIPEVFQFNTEAIGGGVRLTDTKVFDSNGANDIRTVDFWLRKQGESWKKFGKVSEFNGNTDGSIGFNYDISNLEEGKYDIYGRATDKFGAISNGWKESFSVQNIVNVAPTKLGFSIAQISGGINLTNTKVFDANGINDLERVDFQLKKEGGDWVGIQDAVDFQKNQDGSASFDYSISGLEQGNYELKATAYDKAGANGDTLKTYFQVNNAAPTDLQFEIETIGRGIRLTDTKVFDANGINDLSRVDFWLKKDSGDFTDIADAVEFRSNQDGSFSFDYSIDSLVKGNYELWAITGDRANDYSAIWQKSFTIENTAPTQLGFKVQQINGGIQLVDTKVFDENGIDDLERVDFQLKKEGNEWIDIPDALNFYQNQDASIGFNYSISNLTAGNYQLKAIAYDQAGASGDALLTDFNVTDWFEQNIQDANIRALSRSLFSDNTLDRNDAIAILRDAKDNGVVDAIEINDLRTIISNASYLGMADYVRVLSNKVVSGDLANKSGNLQAGSSDVQLDQLINKWFSASERPTTIHTYQYAQGSLFQNGISHDDIKQGYINDCFFLAGLSATIVQSPDIIQNMFIDNGDGTFTVRFYNKGVADYVTVDRYLPTNNIGNFVYANAGNYYGNANNELWVMLAEKAYAQLNESGWINQDNTNSYNGIGNAGYLSDAFAHITGKKSALGRILNFNTVVNAFSSGEIIGFGSKSSGVQPNIVASHAYALIDYNATTQKFTLLNPWSTDNTALKSRTLELSWDDISKNFSYWDSTITNIVST
ncbi:C2 family cysteine protease [Rivularia sp. UHCC 0363]|uniref:C2 family cysteine protease n=1 Tax=Rivularia sp. UHCC 0363 TaxID=3110244 RepID=UPI002B1EC21E|nr:C2 family cysteine protease [Rivularia sp. UHCC 0363]MEA5598695.1 C2 family cysteine protease [Rivularia sp. UHCC 0363]